LSTWEDLDKFGITEDHLAFSKNGILMLNPSIQNLLEVNKLVEEIRIGHEIKSLKFDDQLIDKDFKIIDENLNPETFELLKLIFKFYGSIKLQYTQKAENKDLQNFRNSFYLKKLKLLEQNPKNQKIPYQYSLLNNMIF
jgi:hypothetical protein